MIDPGKLAGIALLVLTSTACGPELVGAGERGTVQAEVTDDPRAAEQTTTARTVRMSRSLSPGLDPVDLEGTITVEAGVEVLSQVGPPIEVTARDGEGTTEIGAGNRADLGRVEEVPVGVYPAVRLTFSRISIGLTGGGVIPDHLSLEVDLSAGPIVVEMPVGVEVLDGELTTIVVDLNAHDWLTLADPVTGLIPPAAVESALTIGVDVP